MVGCSENTVKSRLNYGRKKIEAKVLDLEKQGTKLYSLAPVPFLLWLLKGEANQMLTPSKAVLQAIEGECSTLAAGAANTAGNAAIKKAAAKAAEQTAKQAVKATAGTAAKGFATKVTASILAVSLIGGGVTVVQHRKAEPEVPRIEESAITEIVSEQEPEIPENEQPTIIPELPPEIMSGEDQIEVYAPEATVKILDSEGALYYTYVLTIEGPEPPGGEWAGDAGYMEYHSTGPEFPMQTLYGPAEYILTVLDQSGGSNEVYTKHVLLSEEGTESEIIFQTDYQANMISGTIDTYVRTAREEHINYDTSSTFQGISFGNAYDLWMRLPEITIDSEDARAINQEITDEFEFIIESTLEAQSGNYDCTYNLLDYDAWIYDEMLTVIVSAGTEYGDAWYGIYVLDVTTGSRLTNAEVAAHLGMGNGYESGLKSAIQAKFEEVYGTFEQYQGKPLADFYMTQLDQTLSAENLEKVTLYPAENGTPMASCSLYALAGAESYDYLIPVEQENVSDSSSIQSDNPFASFISSKEYQTPDKSFTDKFALIDMSGDGEAELLCACLGNTSTDYSTQDSSSFMNVVVYANVDGKIIESGEIKIDSPGGSYSLLKYAADENLVVSSGGFGMVYSIKAYSVNEDGALVARECTVVRMNGTYTLDGVALTEDEYQKIQEKWVDDSSTIEFKSSSELFSEE